VPIDPRKARFEKIQRLGLDDVLQFDKEHLQGRPKLISIVGDKNKIDLEKIRKDGAVTELELKDIFAFLTKGFPTVRTRPAVAAAARQSARISKSIV